jgi:hypothetical protein
MAAADRMLIPKYMGPIVQNEKIPEFSFEIGDFTPLIDVSFRK